MKFMKKLVFDFVSPATGHATASISPFSVLARFETLLDTALHGVNTIIRKASTINPASTKKSSAVSIPLIKASTPVFDKRDARLAGRSILCVGGQKHLYPAYRQIVEDAGGHFLSFHSRADTPLSELHKLLNVTDMVICPIDCIRHEAFFVTKRYCDRFHKPCVMLDKSRVTTFYNGIRMLKNLQ
ncbi:MAG: DUF2325 domain-containing protein [Burkholderiales bacterium]|nr:DUF2325 domain-containing protein [Nitrosomonas sp.]MCP5276496.1 DUF2325 domain-containing protein [Burkholderiales bacterium]